jgi:hypothetical protein
MKALVLESYNNLVYKEVDKPVIGSHEVKPDNDSYMQLIRRL